MSHYVHEDKCFTMARSRRKKRKQYREYTISDDFLTHTKKYYLMEKLVVLLGIIITYLGWYFVYC